MRSAITASGATASGDARGNTHERSDYSMASVWRGNREISLMTDCMAPERSPICNSAGHYSYLWLGGDTCAATPYKHKEGMPVSMDPPPQATPGYPPAVPPVGAPAYGYYAGPMPPATSGWAIASVVCAILGVVGIPVFGSILGVIFGHVALGEIRRADGRLVGRGAALAGLIIGYLALALLVVGIILLVVFHPFHLGRFHHFRIVPTP